MIASSFNTNVRPNGFKDNGYLGFPTESIAPCPVNVISLFDDKTASIYSFVYNNSENADQQKFKTEYEHAPEIFKEEIKKKILERNDVIVNNVQVLFYNSEEETIEAFFKTIHRIDPDICASWNQGFDVCTMLNRLTKLYSRKKELREQNISGQEQMLKVVSDSKYSIVKNKFGNEIYLSPKAYYSQRKEKAIVDRMDEFTVLDGIVWFDQMLLYANIRKSTIKDSYALDAIAAEELGSEKLDYSGYSLKNLPWKNFELFLKYNIFDVVLLAALEEKNLDFDMVQKLCEVTNTRKYKVFKKTVSIKNYVCKFAELQGFVMSNNKNAQYGDDSKYFEEQYLRNTPIIENNENYLTAFDKKENFGAYVGDPNLNDYCGVKDSGGKSSKFIFANVFDEDFSALYPSIIRAFNLDKNTQVGKFFLIDNHIKTKLITKYGYDDLFSVSKNEEADATSEVSSSDIGPTLVDSLISHDWCRIGEKYFDLPSTSEMILELRKMKEKV